MYAHERSLVSQLANRSFALIGVNSDADREAILKTCKEKDINWRSFWNGPEGTAGPISTAWKVSGWPTVYVIDANGKIRYKNVRGQLLDNSITALLRELCEEVEITHDYSEEVENDAP